MRLASVRARQSLVTAASLISLTLFGLSGASHAAVPQAPSAGPAPVVSGPFVTPPAAPESFDKSLRQLPRRPPTSRGEPGESRPQGVTDESGVAGHTAPSHQAAGALQSAQAVGAAGVAPGAFTTASPNFTGAGYTRSVPPDTNGDVGPNHYVQVVNSAYQIFDKQGNSLAGPTNINALWSGQNNACANNNNGDPVVLYDHLADRWLISQFALPNGLFTNPSFECVAVSKTADPVNGGWFLYQFAVPDRFDYPKLGLWPDGYYLTSQEGYSGGSLDAIVLDRADMLNGQPAPTIRFNVAGPAFILLPGDLDGAAPPAGTDEVLARAVDGAIAGGADRIDMWRFHTDWQATANSSLTQLSSLPVAPFSSDLCGLGGALNQNCIAQPGTTTKLDALSVWSLGPLQYRDFGGHQSLVFNQTVDADGNGQGHAGLRWYELRSPDHTTWSIAQQGTYAPDANAAGLADDPARWAGSVAMDAAGDMAMGYSGADGSSVYPGLYYTGRLASDPLGLMPEGESTLVAGSSSQTFNGSRWGDYAAMRVDPSDGCTFWFTSEYLDTSLTAVGSSTPGGFWNTRIGAIRFPTCNPADVSVSQLAHPVPATAGQELDYDVTVTNNGPATATDVVATDTLDGGLTYLSSTSASCSAAGSTVSCPLGTLASGASATYAIRTKVSQELVVSRGPGAVVHSSATATATQLDPNSANNTVDTGTQVADSADLAVSKICDGAVQAGQSGRCTVYVDNRGPSAARSVTATDKLSSNGTFSVTSITPSQGSCDPVPPTGSTALVSCALGTLDAATATTTGRATVVINFTATEAQTVNDIAQAQSDTGDPNTTNNSAAQSVPITAVSDLAVSSAAAAPEPVTAGTSLTFTVVATNNGPSTAQSVVLSDALPADVTVTSITSPGASACNAGTPGDALRPATCGFDTLAPGASKTLTIVTQVDPDSIGPLHSDARIDSATFDPDDSNNLAHTDSTVVASANVGLSSSASPNPVAAGTALTFVATVRNGGPSSARSVVLAENLPAGVTFGSATISNGGAGTCGLVAGSGQTVACNLNDLAPNQAVTVFTNTGANPDDVAGTTLTMTSTVSADHDPDTGNNSSTAVTTVARSADLAVAYHGPAIYKPSTTVIYDNVVTNAGPSDAASVVLTDNLPAASVGHYVSDNAGAGSCALAGSVLTCQLATLPAGASREVQVKFFIQGNAKLVTSSAKVTASTPDSVPANNTATWSMNSK